MKAILGEKLHMTQIFDGAGHVVPVTLIRAVPNVITQVKTKEKDGYDAVQLGTGATTRASRVKKPQQGHLKNLPLLKTLREFRIDGKHEGMPTERGDEITVAMFAEGEYVKVSGVAKSKGFQGVVKRYGFAGAPATHGTKHAHRQPGSIGGAGGRAGGKVAKGMRMAGRMGGGRISVRNLLVAKVNPEHNLLAVRGAVPGRRGTVVEIRSMK